jgi:hypothetical protein
MQVFGNPGKHSLTSDGVGTRFSDTFILVSDPYLFEFRRKFAGLRDAQVYLSAICFDIESVGTSIFSFPYGLLFFRLAFLDPGKHICFPAFPWSQRL